MSHRSLSAAVVLIMSLIAGPAFGQSEAVSVAAENELAALRAENAKLRAQVAALEAEVATLRQATQQMAKQQRQIEQQAAAAESEQREYYLDIEYDGDADRTTIASRVGELRTASGAPWRRHWLHIEAERDGKAGKVRDIHLAIETFATGKVYNRLDTITLTAGDTQIEAEIVDYDSDMKISGSVKNRRRTDDETITAAITKDELRQLAAASEVTGRLGTRDFQLSRDHIRALRTLQAELGTE